MNKIKILAFCAAILVTSGCASVENSVTGETKQLDRPGIGAVGTKEIGESLLEYYNLTTSESIRTLEEFVFLGISVPPQILRPISTGKTINAYAIDKTSRGIGLEACHDTTTGRLFLRSGLGICDLLTKSIVQFPPVNIDTAVYTDLRRPYFRQELIYSGRSGNTLKLLYREYINDNIRFAYSQEIQYDLLEDAIIGFKGARIQIISSTNREIRYKVLKSFDR